MKYIIIKIFYEFDSFGARIMYGNIKDNQKFVEKDSFKVFSDIEELKKYLSNISFNINYLKAKLFIDFIFGEVLIETIIKENEVNKNVYIKEKLSDIYPKYINKYDVYQEDDYKNNRFKNYYLIMIPKKLSKTMTEIVNMFYLNKKVFGVDCLLFQQHLNKNIHYFYKKNIVLIQKDCSFWRFYKIINGKIVDYLVLNEDYEQFNKIKNEIFNEIVVNIDEIIIDSDYRSYALISEEIRHQNITYIECAPRLKNIDERKIFYAKEFN